MSGTNGNIPADNEEVGGMVSFNRQAEQDEEDTLLGGLDLIRLYQILKKNIIWLIMLPIISLLCSYIYLRYTKPLYESSSSIKLEVKREANVLGLTGVNTVEDVAANLPGEIELIRSNLIYEEVIKRIDMGISYFAYGNILEEERYKNSPFSVKYELYTGFAYDRVFNVTLLNNQQYELNYQVGEQEISQTYTFGQSVKTADFLFVVDTTQVYSPELQNTKYYFKINSAGALTNYIASNVRVDILNPAASILGISFTDHNIAKARDIVNTIDSVYLTKTLEIKNKANKQKLEFLDEQLRNTEANLEEYESQLESFIVKNKTTDIESDVGKFVTKIEELLNQKTLLNSQLDLLRKLQLLIDTEGDLESFIPSIPLLTDPQLAALTTEINQLQQDRSIALSSRTEATFAVQAKNQAIGIARKNISTLIVKNKELVIDNVRQINNKISELENTFALLPSKGTEYTKIKRFKDLYDKYYLMMMDRKAELGIAEAGTVPEFVILSPASTPSKPIAPNKMMIYGSAGAFGLLLSMLLLSLRYILHDSISNQRELERTTQAPILGAIPTYLKEKMDVSRLIINKNPKASISESFRTIRTNMEFLLPSKKKKRIITVTSTVSGEGKTFVSLNLAGVIALSDTKVIILDLDMRKPKIHLAFDDENFAGISTILIGKHKIQDCIRNTSIRSLDYIAAGPTPPNPSELILRPEFDTLLKELHQFYDVIVIDTPPVGLVTDGILVMKKADLPVYVVRADYSKRYFIKNINKLIKNNNFGRLSIILNAFKHLSQYGYGYDYSYYQGYDEDDNSPASNGLFKKKKMIGQN
ncbi:polysaccharide biosynthesis tyrosine autokinase [Rhodocytophaga aerolata]|uniref:non-specific protein-tyrosine kinase n=1 Tax=Rhodocytophaga aerolata TaxID=455078 RepID=A0ABT8R2H0_9BACT|nr:polysaccharide biosynthesis tyrosine autokinase [Rhodocytophaga aerolata]MDO1445554.1 polysaccharide biosynthesis tyrosine autokinase [Rhodocytophaga aerolata]